MSDPSTTDPRRRGRRTALALAAVAAVVLPTAVFADDGSGLPEIPDAPEDVTVLGYHGNGELAFVAPLGRVYGSVGDGYAVISGETIEVVCSGVAPADTLGTARQASDGTWENRTPLGGVIRTAYVYEVNPNEGVFDFFGRVCPAIGAGEPAPVPFASGEVRQRDRQWELDSPYNTYTGPQQPGRYKNSVKGDVTAPDGTVYELIAKVDYRLDGNGPPEFFTDRLKLRVED